MGNEGQFATFVGGLTSKSHMEWIDGALARQRAKYPALEQVAERMEDYDDQNIAYEKTKELLTTYPNLRGIQGSASTTAAGAGLAVEERGLQDKVMIVGTSLVAQTRPYLESGSVKLISFWDPADAGYAMNRIAEMLLEGKTLTDGTDLGLAGYESLKQDPNKPILFYGNAWVDVTKENMDEFDF
jgi:simple sugar transport system substrate-binding protein